MITLYENSEIKYNLSEKSLKGKKNTNIISNKIISKINVLIEDKNENAILKKLELLKKLGKQKYLKAKNIKKKEVIFNEILINLEKLLNNLNYIEIYNSDSSIGKTSQNYSDINVLKNMVSIGLEKNIEGANCNSWILFIYELIKYITNNEVKFDFFILKNINHGVVYMKIHEKLFLYHLYVGHILKIAEDKVSLDKYENKKTIEEFTEYVNKNSLRKRLSFSKGRDFFKIHNIKIGFILELKSDDKNYKRINTYIFKKISKIIYRFIKYGKYLGYNLDSNNIDEIKEYIINQYSNSNEKEFVKTALNNFNDQKLKLFFKKKK